MKMIQHLVMKKAMLKYTILKIRSKISFYAFYSRNTIVQLFIGQMLKTDKCLNGQPDIFEDQEILKEFYYLLTRGCTEFFQFIIRLNLKQGHVKSKRLEKSVRIQQKKRKGFQNM